MELFSARPDKDWSFIDCNSMNVCAELEISSVLTHDHHFAQAGLRPLIR
jgi:predicted nucleic acid-binding protein